MGSEMCIRDSHYHVWVSTTQIQRGREPTAGGSDMNTIVFRCSWRPNQWPNCLHAGSVQCSQTFRELPPCSPATIDTINYVFARVGRALFQVRSGASKFQLSCPFSSKGTQTPFTTGQYSPNFVSQFTTQFRHAGKPTISTR